MSTEEQQEDGVTAADVCLYGIDIIMPLMTLELLKFPTLCLNYFRTVTLLAEIYPEKICNLNPDLQKNLVLSLELGLTAVGNDSVYQLCCDFVQVLCSYMVRSRKCHQVAFYEAMRPFLKVREWHGICRESSIGRLPVGTKLLLAVTAVKACVSLLQLILDLILSQNINSDLLPFASSTLYVLICCFQVSCAGKTFSVHVTD